MCQHPAHQVNVSRKGTLCAPYFSSILRHPVEHDITPFRFQAAQKNSASFRSSFQQFENSLTSYPAL